MSDTADFDLHTFQRNKYFYGKLMSVRDFEIEQAYFNEKRQMLNRILHGPGIVCGLDDPSVTAGPDGKVRITFLKGGVALDRGGREIVVPDGTIRPVTDNLGLELTSAGLSSMSGPLYLYVRYSESPGELVAAASNPSSCDETCCPNRIIEDFEIIWASTPPVAASVTCPDLSGNIDGTTAKNRIREWIRNEARECPSTDDLRIFLCAVNKDLTPHGPETAAHRINVATHTELLDLLTCHLSDFNNPHHTTAAQTGALASVDGVSNAGGNVDLMATNAITITANTSAKTITFGESHSGQSGNPHNTKHSEIKEVLQADPARTDEARDRHVSNRDANRWNTAIRTLNGVTPDGEGNVTIAPGKNITVEAGPEANTLTISSTAASGGGAEWLTGLYTFKDLKPGVDTGSEMIALPENGIYTITVSLQGITSGRHGRETVESLTLTTGPGPDGQLYSVYYQKDIFNWTSSPCFQIRIVPSREFTTCPVRWFAMKVPGVITPITPIGPVSPVGPVSPISPVGPVSPVSPTTPVSPISPVGPVSPVSPVSPISPVSPTGPVTPVSPIGPVSPVSPTGPVTPVSPIEPVGPRVTPVTPASPEPGASTPLRGMSQTLIDRLVRNGIKDMEALAAAKPEDVAAILKMDLEGAQKLIDVTKRRLERKR